MALLLTAPQCFFIAMIAFGVTGFFRGWRREIVSMAISLAGVLFLYLGGGRSVAQFIFVRLPVITQLAVGSAPSSAPPAPTATQVFAATVITFIVIVALGYLIGNRAMPKATTPSDRFWGVIPAVFTGYILITYVTNVLANSSLITFGITTPSQNSVGNYMLIIFVVAVVAVVAALIASSVKKSGGGAGKPK